MTTIEERIVSMQFQGDKFLAGVDKSLSKLDQLNAKLKMTEGTKGLDDIGAAAQRQSGPLGKIADGVSRISDRFKALSVVGVTALATITNQAVTAGEAFVKSFTSGPLTDGFHEYETNLNAIQTILSNTAAAGTNLKDVNAALNELNHYSDQTIYNFAEMAKNIGTFTAAGVDLKTSVSSIKGIANLAALSGSNSEQASTAMYQLSQAISAGKVSLEDWNSVVNAGLGGTVFQRALATNAEKLGTLSKGAVKLKGDMKNVTVEGKSFRDSLTAKPGEQSWLTTKVLTQTLAQFTGDLSDAALKAQGFNKAQIAAIQSQAKMAKNAATQVKTLSQLLSTVRESIGSGWTQTWQTVFGDFTEARSLFTNINNVLGKYISASANARNKVLADWKAMGGRTAIIKAIGNVFQALIAVVKPIKDAFREIFPAVTGKQLASISKSIESFTKYLIIGGTTANNLKRTFAGFFAILGIGWDIIKAVASAFFSLLGIVTKGSGGILGFTARVGDFIVELKKAIERGDGLNKFLQGLVHFLAGPIGLIKKLIGYIGQLFGSFNGTKAADDLVAKFKPFSKLGDVVGGAWSKVGAILQAVLKFFAPVAAKFEEFFSGIGKTIASAFSGIDYGNVLKSINTGLFAGLVLMLHNLIKKFKGGVDSGGGLFDGIKEALEQLTGTLSAMQKVLKAAVLLEIAAALGILTISLVALSKIDAGSLTRALTAITVMFTQLFGFMFLFQKFGTGSFIKLGGTAAALILLAAAVDVLAVAVGKMAKLDWNGLAKGLTGTVGLLGALVVVVKLMPKGPGMINSSASLVILASAIRVLVSAVSKLAGMSWEQLGKGLLGVGAILSSLTLFTKYVEADKASVLSGVGIVLLAAGIKILASAMSTLANLSMAQIGKSVLVMAGALTLIAAALTVIPPEAPLAAASILITALSLVKIADALDQMGQMSWGEIGRGMTSLLGALGIITGVLAVVPPTGPVAAASILILSLTLGKIADALDQMSQMSWGEILKSMVTLGASLGIISAAMFAMSGALPGAAATLVVAAALAVLTPVLTTLGSMSWGEIGKGLLTLAGVFVVLGLAGVALAPVVPILIGLGVAIVLLGAGMALAGVGLLAFSTGLAALAVTGAAGTAVIVGMVAGIISLIPQAMAAIGAGIIAFAKVISTAGPALTQAMTTVLLSLISSINKVSPQIISTFYKLMALLLATMAKYEPKMVDSGLKLVAGLLNGIAKNANKLTGAATNVIVAFIGGIAKNQLRIIQAGVTMIVNFINGMASAIRKNSSAVGAAGANLGTAIVEGMVRGLASGVGTVASKAREVAGAALSAAKSVLGIHSPSKEFEKIGIYVTQGFVKGLDGNKASIVSAIQTLANQLKSAMLDSAKDVDTLTAKLKKLESARKKDASAISATKKALAEAKKEHAIESSTYTEVTKKLGSQETALGKLADKYDVLTTKIKAAQDTYAAAVKTRDDYKTSITDEFSALTQATGDTSVTDYLTTLQKQLDDTKSFANTLQALRKLGLNDDMYKQLLATGTSALPFVQELLKDGKSSITQINSLDKQIDSVASSLGSTASSQLYQAAVDSAAGLVKGLQNQQAAIEKQMDKIADAMVNAIKKKLGIKSPSRVFAEVGSYSAQGLSSGLEKSSAMVAATAASVGDTAVEALRVSLSNVDKMVAGNIDVQPTIRPVLDLTDIQKNAGKLNSLIPTNAKMTLSGAVDNAASVSTAISNARVGSDDPGTPSTGAPLVAYTQNNYSPKALSPVDIYRGTKNQLSTVKGALST